MKESKIQQHIISYLSLIAIRNNIVFFSPLNETAMMILKMFKIPDAIAARIINFLKKMGLISGIPDIWIGYNGKSFFLEVKNETGKVSATQGLIHRALKRCGFDVYVVRSVEEVQEILNSILEIK